MTKREFLDTVFALAPNEANAIMDAFDEYVESNVVPAGRSGKERRMSKYIIEIPDDVQYVLLNGQTDNKCYTAVRPVADLEELNSDYINEHYGELQDEAYQKGFEDGKNSIDMGCEGCRYSLRFAKDEPCKSCSNCYKSKYEPMPKDEICFGDEIVVNGERGVVVSHENEGSNAIWALLNGYRTPQIVENNYAKTGRHFGIEEIMEAMRK